MDVTRRNLIQILSAAPAVAAAQTQAEHEHAAPAAPAKKAYARKVFNDHQWRTVQVLCDLIIPADEHSGSATAAGVPEFIDDWLDFRTHEDGNDNFAAGILGGLTWLDAESTRLFQKDFAAAAPAAADADPGSHRLAGARRRGRPPLGRVLHALPRSHGQRLLLQQDGRRRSAVSGKQGGGRMEGLRPEGLGGDRRAHEERLQGSGRRSQALDGVVTTTPRCLGGSGALQVRDALQS